MQQRSILAARGPIERGIGWRIGIGSVVNIWNDSWIPGPGDGRINCHNIDINYTTVDQLITSRHCTWKEDIVRAITDWDQADCILNIPLTKSKQADTMVWKYEGMGDYTVKSGYKLPLLDKLRIPDAYPSSMLQSNSPIQHCGLYSFLVRNRLVHYGVRKTVNELVGFIFGYLHEIEEISPVRVITVHSATDLEIPPDPGSTVSIGKILGRGGDGGKDSRDGLNAMGKECLIWVFWVWSIQKPSPFTPNLATKLFSLFGCALLFYLSAAVMQFCESLQLVSWVF
ncbi:hypothetical protein PVK06_034193 [Gossypium arboreum]|uniref:Uncharacterized protein n=1 Tax=Gossypium arboreum TaxID=29729 RepID=A0ABR0NDI7_GOSAR|nr:hypothetical protein PVK06_034193 [Gossypium arboreum]